MTANQASIEALLAEREWVRALARSLVSDVNQADDAEQETWLAAATTPPRDASTPRAWLATVLRNFVRRGARGEGRRRLREMAASRPESMPSTAEMVARAEAGRRVVDAVLALPEPYRAAILARFFEDMPPREIARRLGAPVETVRTRIKRGLALLRERLDAEYGGDGRAWGIALLPLAWRAEPAPTGATTAAVWGGLIMKATTKAAIAVAALLLLGVGAWWAMSDGSTPTSTTAPATETAAAPTAARPPARRSRSEVPDADATRPQAESAPPATVTAAPVAALPDTPPEGELVGKVLLGAERTPLEGVTIRVMGGSGSPGVAATVPKLKKQTTGPDGAFRYAGLAPGHYLFMADAPGRGARRFEANVPRSGGLVTVDVLFGVGGTIVGHVATADGPAVGVTVRLEEMPLSCKTDGDGNYRLEDVAGGNHDNYTVHVEATDADGRDLDGRTAHVVLASGETRRVDFLAEALLTGVVTLDGAPVAGATVWVGEGAGGGDFRSFRTTTGKDGSYRLRMAPGDAQVKVIAAGRFSVPVDDVSVHAGENQRDIRLGEGEFTERISGRVFVKATGEPVSYSAFHLSLYPADRVPKTADGQYAVGAGGFRDAQGKYVFGADAIQDAKGRFDCGGLRRGLWRLVVHAYQGQPGHPDLRGADFDVNLLPGLPHEFEIGLEEGPEEPKPDGSVSWLSGKVLDAWGSPLPGAVVYASAKGLAMQRVQADRDGRYSVRHLQPGTWKLSVMEMSAGGSSQADVTDATIVAGSNTLDLRLPRAGTAEVSGRVFAKASGKPLSAPLEVQLSLYTADDGRFVAGANSKDDGRFTFPSLRPGRLRLIATPKTGSLREKSLDVDVAAGAKVENLEVALEAMATGKVAFHVKDEADHPIDLSVVVQFAEMTTGGMSGGWGGTSPNGVFEWHFEAGRHVVRAWTMKTTPEGKPTIDRDAQVTLDVREGETADVDVMLHAKK